jgi:hypothetical protein
MINRDCIPSQMSFSSLVIVGAGATPFPCCYPAVEGSYGANGINSVFGSLTALGGGGGGALLKKLPRTA